MKNEKEIKLLMALFERDINRNKGISHITDLMLLTIKSLMPSEDYLEVNVDYKRYSEEIKLWEYYRHGDNESLLNITKNVGSIDSNVYWKAKDDSVYSRILPIIITNKDYSNIKKEVIKNILFTTGNIETIIEGLLIAKLIHLLILDKEEIIEELKKEIIELTQVGFIEEFQKYFRVATKEYNGNFPANFERLKINGLSMLNSLDSNKFKVLKDSLDVVLYSKSGMTNIGRTIEVYMKDDTIDQFKDKGYYEELAIYNYRLKEGRIDPENLQIEKYYLPDIFALNEGEVFYHSLLNRSKVLKIERINNKSIYYISSKSGNYKFIK